MFDNLEKTNIKNIVLKALEDFVDLQVNLSSSNGREVIAVRIASDILNAQNEQPLSPEEIQKN
jgi:hypothetical protein